MPFLYWTVALLVSAFLTGASFSCIHHHEFRAGRIFILLLMLQLLLFLPPLFVPEITPTYEKILLSGIILLAIILFIPFKGGGKITPATYGKSFHEADSVLSRRLLKPGTRDYQNYYEEHPEYREADDRARQNPGLLSANSRYYDPYTFSAAEANFRLTDHLHELTETPVNPHKTKLEAHRATSFITDWLIRSGAKDVGVTPLMPHHLYSHKGRGERRGEPVQNDHTHAIAFTVEMDHEMMQYAPAGPTVMESADRYLQSGTIATALALMIREMGYGATPHIDGNYEVICPLVAVDAGLGEIGRMGLLMTPRLGPRVRIAVVTTDLSLVTQPGKPDQTIIDFCIRCRKCAVTCPVAAIPNGERKVTNGSLRWRIDSEKCYNYWTVAGTDCGRCVVSCPYNHPDHWIHLFIRWGTKNNLLFRIMAVKLDDVFYGRKPAIKKFPDHNCFIKHK